MWVSLEKILGSFDLEAFESVIISEVLTSQYCNKYDVYQTKKVCNWQQYQYHNESAHNEDPMDDIRASIKNDINNAIAFSPSCLISCASELWDYLPKDHKQIGMYNEREILRYKEMLPQNLKITSKSFEIGSIDWNTKFMEINERRRKRCYGKVMRINV